MSSASAAPSADVAASASAPAAATPQVAYGARLTLGEGALWSVRDQCLYFLDINEEKLLRYTPPSAAGAPASEGRTDSVHFGSKIGCLALTSSPQQLLVAAANGLHLFDWSSLQSWLLAPFPLSGPEASGFRFNDGGVSPQGSFLVGTMALDEEKGAGKGVLYEYALDEASGTVKHKAVLEGVSISNGIDWSADGQTVYYIDTPTHRIDRFVWAPQHSLATSGSDDKQSPLTQRAEAFPFPEKEHKHPDGFTLDAQDRLWIASFAGGRVTCWTAQGQLLSRTDFPSVSQTTCPVFGGASLRDLFMTTAARDTDPAKEPQAGNLFVLRDAAQGRPQREAQGDFAKAVKDKQPAQHKIE